MFLQKLSYYNEKGVHLPQASKRIEFMVHYWQYVFSYQHFRLDEEWLKSHRGLLQRIKLQIETNYESFGCCKKVKKFLVDEPFFDLSNAIIKSLPVTWRSEIFSLQTILSGSFNKIGHVNYISAKDILTKLNKIIAYFEMHYSKKLRSELLKELSSNKSITDDSITNLRSLLNCLIVELLSKGFTKKYLSDLVFKIQNVKTFPYDRMRGDFETDQEFENYANGIFSSLTLRGQIDGMINLLDKKERKFEVIYKVYGVNWQLDPLEILNVKFYNPSRDGIITSSHFYNEDFTIADGKNQNPNSFCNAIVHVEGIQESMILDRAYFKVSAALSILNAQIEKQCYLKREKALIAVEDKTPKVLFGTFSAINDIEVIASIPEFKKDDIDYVNQLDWSLPKDQNLIRLISEISELMKSDSKYSILDIYSNLEGYFGKEGELKSMFFNCFKIWSNKHYPVSIKLLLINGCTSTGIRFEVKEEHQLSKADIRNLGLDIAPGKAVTYTKLMNNLSHIDNCIDTPFWKWIIKDALEFRDSRSAWNIKMKGRIDYYIDELNTERNLIAHSRQTEDYTRIRKQEFFNFILIILRVYTSYHLSYKKRKPVFKVSEKIERIANVI